MNKKTTKPKFVLLDADVVIEAYKIGVWSDLIDSVEIAIPSIVARDEALRYSKEMGRIPYEIDLVRLIHEGRICELSASASEINELRSRFDRVFIEGLHDGETEALALIYSGKASGYKFCSGDKVAIQGLAMIGHSSSGISMQNLFNYVGLTKQLSHQFTESYFKKWLEVGKERLITEDGLSRTKE